MALAQPIPDRMCDEILREWIRTGNCRMPGLSGWTWPVLPDPGPPKRSTRPCPDGSWSVQRRRVDPRSKWSLKNLKNFLIQIMNQIFVYIPKFLLSSKARVLNLFVSGPHCYEKWPQARAEKSDKAFNNFGCCCCLNGFLKDLTDNSVVGCKYLGKYLLRTLA